MAHAWIEQTSLQTRHGSEEEVRGTGRHAPEWLAWHERKDQFEAQLRSDSWEHQANQRCTEGYWKTVDTLTTTVHGSEYEGHFVRAGIPRTPPTRSPPPPSSRSGRP